jgi:hypothetical protein
MTKSRENSTTVPQREEVLQPLRDTLGVARLAEESGAEVLMQGILWELCRQYLHRLARGGTQNFPGLEDSC